MAFLLYPPRQKGNMSEKRKKEDVSQLEGWPAAA
jgi:hypothetical protein